MATIKNKKAQRVAVELCCCDGFGCGIGLASFGVEGPGAEWVPAEFRGFDSPGAPFDLRGHTRVLEVGTYHQ